METDERQLALERAERAARLVALGLVLVGSALLTMGAAVLWGWGGGLISAGVEALSAGLATAWALVTD